MIQLLDSVRFGEDRDIEVTATAAHGQKFSRVTLRMEPAVGLDMISTSKNGIGLHLNIDQTRQLVEDLQGAISLAGSDRVGDTQIDQPAPRMVSIP